LRRGGIYIGGDNFDSAIMWERGTPHFGRGLTYQSIPNKWLEIPISFFLNICSWEKLNFFDSKLRINNLKSVFLFKNNKNVSFRRNLQQKCLSKVPLWIPSE
jgi:hypothetical chaperone protein